jgi:tetratricopeptide (TPR) repeat protein
MAVFAALLVSSSCARKGVADYVELGKKFQAERKYEDASIQYRKALQSDPNSSEAKYRLGLLAIDQGNFKEAYEYLSQALEANPEDDGLKARLADVSLMLYVSLANHPPVTYQRATTLSDQLLAKDANSFDGLRLKGSLRLLDQKPKEAIEYFDKANQIRKLDADLVVAWTQAFFQANRIPDGERLAMELIRVNPKFGPIYDVLYRQYISTNRPTDAERILKLKAANNPGNISNVLQLAEYYTRTNRTADAKQVLEQIVNSPSHFPRGRLDVGEFYGRIGNWPEAMHQFEEGQRANPKDRLLYQKRIVSALIAQNKSTEATHAVEALFKEEPKDPEVRRVWATLRLESGNPADLDAAITEFKELAKLLPNDAVVHFNFARAWLGKRELENARLEFLEARRSQPEYVPALNALAAISLQQQRTTEAINYVGEILSYEPENIQAQLLGVSALATANRFGEAHTILANLQKLRPDDGNVQLQIGFLALAEKKYADAEKIFQRVHQTGVPDPRPSTGLAEVYSARQQYDRAIALLQEDLRKSPDSVELRAFLAYVAGNAGRHDLAISEYQTLLSKEPQSIELHVRLGSAQLAKGDYEAAEAVLQSAQQLGPNQPEPALMLAMAQEKTGHVKEAMTNYRKVLQTQPDNGAALNNLSYLMAQNGDLDEALRLVQRALQKEPGQANYTDTLGFIYLKKNLVAGAVQTFQSLVLQHPQNPTFHQHLGEALLAKGDTQAAQKEFDSARSNSVVGN